MELRRVSSGDLLDPMGWDAQRDIDLSPLDGGDGSVIPEVKPEHDLVGVSVRAD
jgi:hypothetical protein